MKRPSYSLWIVLAAALGAGTMVWLRGDIEWTRAIIALAFAAAAAALAHRRLGLVLEKLRPASPLTAVIIAVLAAGYLTLTAFVQQRDLFPKVHDEHSYLLGARLAAMGRLWLPQHPLADFFDSFHILTRPRYASIYFPGTALLNAPGIWASLPTWELPLLMAAGCVALTYLIVARLLDGVWGIVAAVLVVSTGLFRTHSTLLMSQIPATLLGLAMIWAYLRWRDRPTIWRAALIGVFAGWAAITRPVDALAFAAPLAAAMLLDFYRRGPRVAAGAIAAVLVGAAPFLALQVVFNIGLTGHVFRTPYTVYLEQNQPGTQFGAAAPPRFGDPQGVLPQKRDYLHALAAGNFGARGKKPLAAWATDRAKRTIIAALPAPLLAGLAVIGLAAAARRRQWILAWVAPLFFGLYLLNPFFLPHYAVPLAPTMALLTAAGAAALAHAAQRWRHGSYFAVLLPIVVAALAISRLPELNAAVRDEWIDLPTVRMAHQLLPQAVQGPAVIFFRYRAGDNVHDEPVYNDETSWPDDARIVRVHDLGKRNEEVIAYYAKRQPARRLYLFDRASATLYPYESAPAAAVGAKE